MFCSSLLSLLLFTLAVGGHSVENEVRFMCGEDAVLNCMAKAEPGVNYHFVIWYKVNDESSHKVSGLVMKRLTENNGTVHRYKGFTRDAEVLENSLSLLLSNVTQEDAGRYVCSLSAPIGHHNQKGNTDLSVIECPKDEYNDTLYVVLAITLLIMALMMFYISYICLRNTLTSHKHKLSNGHQLKTAQKIKHIIVNLESKGPVSKILHQEYV